MNPLETQDAPLTIFGPVPSRRLGRSLGINHIPPKTCSYACVYCQIGRTNRMQLERQGFHAPEAVAEAVRHRLDALCKAGETVDYLTFVPDGEPTIDLNLERAIDLLKPLGIPIAVITNGSLINREDVRRALHQADLVSLKVDTVDRETWCHVDRPHGVLELAAILEGMRLFARAFRGTLVTETMLVAGVNDGEEQVAAVADFLAQLTPSVAYLAIPTRPPAEPNVGPPSENVLNRAYQQLAATVWRVEYLTGYEGNAFASTGDAKADILSITSVHPLRDDAMAALLQKSGTGAPLLRRLLAAGELVETTYGGHRFYVRKFNRRLQFL